MGCDEDMGVGCPLRSWSRVRVASRQLKGSLRQLNDKIEEAKRKRNILVARQKRAEAQGRIQETMSSMSDKSAFENFERMTEKIEESERKALAAAELNEDLSGDFLQQEFEALEYHGSADQQLLELKQKMGLLAPGEGDRPQLGSGDEDVDDAEVVDEIPAEEAPTEDAEKQE